MVGMKTQKTIWQCTCDRCSHSWTSRNGENLPVICPRCKSPYWDKPKRYTSKFNTLAPLEPEISEGDLAAIDADNCELTAEQAAEFLGL